jgi:DNA-binding winged helix-turn-helix (wHTH) protein
MGPDIHTDTEAGIHTAILKIRQVLGVSRELPPFVETVPGKGYRFVAPVEVVTQSPREKSSALLPRLQVPSTLFRLS